MQASIQEKLKASLSKDIIEERDVVYILVEAGKLIEITKTWQDYPALWFYRNWVVHSEIGKQTAFLRELKPHFENMNPHMMTDGALEFLTFDRLSSDMRKFFHRQIQNNMIPDIRFLYEFQVSLKKVIMDIPVRIKIEDEITLTLKDDNSLNVSGPKFNGSIKLVRADESSAEQPASSL